MSFPAVTIRDTYLVSLRNEPEPVADGTPLTVYRESNGWGAVVVTIAGEDEPGEMRSSDYQATGGAAGPGTARAASPKRKPPK